jgi:hypothetical protein
LWYPWFIDTSSGWIVRVGERWDDSNFTRWNADDLRAILRDIRDSFNCNCVRAFFWMDWVTQNSRETTSSYYPTSEIGSRDALHALCDIAYQENMDVELRMWGWNPKEGRNDNMLLTHTTTDFINAWVWFAKEFSRHPNVFFNLYDETTIPFSTWRDLAYNTIMQIRVAGVGHVVYVHYYYCGGEGIDWIRQFGNHYNVAFSRHEYIYHGTTEAMHRETIQIHDEGYPVTVTAGGAYDDNAAEIETYKRWWAELLNKNIGISVYTYGRPNVMGFRVQQDTFFQCPPNNQGAAFRDIGLAPPPPMQYTLSVYSTPITGIPFTLNGTTKVTPYSASLDQGTYALAMPSNLLVGSDTYNFQQWDDLSTNPSKTISLTADMAVTALYQLVVPPPAKAYLEIHAFLDSVEVVADGLIVETGTTFQTPSTIEVDSGTYTIRLTTGGITKTYTVAVAEGQTLRVDGQFAFAPPTPISPLWIGLGSVFFGSVILIKSIKPKS